MKKLATLLLSVTVALGTIGCGAKEDEEEESNAVAEAALDMSEASSAESAMMATLVAPAAQAASGSTVTSDDVAAAAEAGGTATLMCPYKGTVPPRAQATRSPTCSKTAQAIAVGCRLPARRLSPTLWRATA